MENEKIDIVIPWVDDSDLEWIKEKQYWFNKINPDQESNSNIRYQSWDNLKYLFRAIEKFLPWVNHIFFITWGHIPGFLNIECPKLSVIKHTDYIPQEYLPTFNANTIELNLHRIQELSENFIYFNDDTFPLTPIPREYYFCNNLPCDEAIESPIVPKLFGDGARFSWNMRALDVSIINKHFNKREVQKKYHAKWFAEVYEELLERNERLNYWDNFIGFRDPHVPLALKKSTFEKVWRAEPEILDATCKSKFRNTDCVNHWLIRYWQLCEGNFVPRKTLGQSYIVTMDNYYVIAGIVKAQSKQMICINEECSEREFKIVKQTINGALEIILPEKSMFEK